MSTQNRTNINSKIFAWLVTLLAIGFLIFIFLMKGKLNNYLSKSIKSQSGTELIKSAGYIVDSLYNYSNKTSTFEITFLEFGAKNCVACRKMETVMKKIDEEYPETVKVVFLNILQPQNQDLMKYFGIIAIPTQILLDKQGNEYFRHSGFISFHDLRKQLILNTKKNFNKK